MKKIYLSLCIVLGCLQAVFAQFQCLHSTATFEYTGTTMIPRDSSYLCYVSGHTKYDTLTHGWEADTVNYYSNTGTITARAYKTYNAAGKVATRTEMLLSNGNWVAAMFTRYEYTATGKMQVEVTHFESGQYDSTRIYYNYYGNDLVKEELAQDWQGGWINRSRTSHAYDGSNREILNQRTNWDIFNSQWQNSDRSTTTYTGNTAEVVREVYNNGNWENSSKSVITYNANGKPGNAAGSQWNGSAWVNTSKTIYQYNANGNIEEEQQQVWSGTTYINSTEWVYAYDMVKEVITAKLLVWNTVANKFEMTLGSYETRDYYQWATGIGNSLVNDNTGYHVYPVPAKNILHLLAGVQAQTATTISITDMTGKLVKMQQLPALHTADETIDISALPAGAYLLHINAGGSTMMKKLVVSR